MTYVAFQAEASDLLSIGRLWSENLSDLNIARATGQRLHWMYKDPRAGGVRTWVVRKSETGEVVGCATVCPRLLHAEGRDVRAGILSDFAIARAHRAAGPAIALQRKILTDTVGLGFDLLYGFPNHGAAPILHRIGYSKVGVISRWVRPLRTEARLLRYLHPILAKGISMAADGALALNDARLGVAFGGGLREESLLRADERFDDLWERGKAGKPATCARSSAYLNWRYADFTTANYQLFCLVDPARNALRGYVVWSAHRDAAHVADLFWDRTPRALEALLVRFCRRMRSQGLATVHLVCLADDHLGAILRRLLFFTGATKERAVVAHAGPRPPEHLRPLLRESRKWLLFDGDLDL